MRDRILRGCCKGGFHEIDCNSSPWLPSGCRRGACSEQPGVRANLQARQSANRRIGVLDCCPRIHGPTHATTGLLAFGCLSHTRLCGSSQRTAWNRCRVAWKSLATKHRRHWLASIWWRAGRRNRSTSDQSRRKLLGPIHGSDFQSWNDSASTYPLWSRSLDFSRFGRLLFRHPKRTSAIY